jgi:hypothetical protein
MGDTWRNIILVLKLIIDYKHQDYKHQKYRNNQRSGKKPPSEQKNPDKGDGQYWSVLSLAQKMIYVTNVSCRLFIWQPNHPRLQEGGKQKAWRNKWKYASFLWLHVFPLQLFPLQLFQDHRNRNMEASGIAMTCSFHQAIPGSLQVVVPVRNI